MYFVMQPFVVAINEPRIIVDNCVMKCKPACPGRLTGRVSCFWQEYQADAGEGPHKYLQAAAVPQGITGSNAL